MINPNNPFQVKLLLEQKEQFQNFCKAYLNSFGWTILKESPGEIDALDSLSKKFKILIIARPYEEYPSYNQLKKIKEDIILMGPEYSGKPQIKGNKSKKVVQHTASGINFTYLTNNEK